MLPLGATATPPTPLNCPCALPADPNCDRSVSREVRTEIVLVARFETMRLPELETAAATGPWTLLGLGVGRGVGFGRGVRVGRGVGVGGRYHLGMTSVA